MIKNNKIKVIISSVITLLPMLIGIILWDKLPETMATHWGPGGEADGFSSKAFAVFALPLIFAALHFVCIFASSFDKKNIMQNAKALGLVYWICPGISIFTSSATYATALGSSYSTLKILPILLGLMFIAIGNYMPKCRQNFTLGIKLPWTLGNEENWNSTHRFGGKMWVFGGIVMMFMGYLPVKYMAYVALPAILLIALAPALYSYLLFRKQLKEGRATKDEAKVLTRGKNKKYTIFSIVAVGGIVIALIFVMFTGNIEFDLDEDTLDIDPTFWGEVEIDYSKIERAELREGVAVGMKVNGFNSARLLLGGFENDEFGYYTRYTYRSSDTLIVLYGDGGVLVIGARDEAATRALYDRLIEKIG